MCLEEHDYYEKYILAVDLTNKIHTSDFGNTRLWPLFKYNPAQCFCLYPGFKNK